MVSLNILNLPWLLHNYVDVLSSSHLIDSLVLNFYLAIGKYSVSQ